ncbi:hypothetical protein M8C21_005356 [Ambrosia artemisiifolia]|uniref:Uncharacterized protein n=1 Tax=Ambrosia artemisiifolia TaxID=4212 RepID=A0AAD5CT30_AMBAR|nr:hypothetical protein M8C21_005356 [Ambrosia artemisiifolia]
MPPIAGPSVGMPTFSLSLTQEQPTNLSQPCFSLGITPEAKGLQSPGGEVSGNGIVVRGVTEIVTKTGNADPLPKEHEQVAGLSQPSFSLGITQEAKSPRARGATFVVLA